MTIDKGRVKRILIIKLRGIGDVILSTGIINNLIAEFPGAKIDYLTEKPSKAALTGIENINEILLLERNSNAQKLKLILGIRKRKYDLVFDFFSNPTTALITFLSGAYYRAGFPYRGRKYAYNLFGPAERQKYHSADLHYKTIENLGIRVNSKDLLFALSNEEKIFADNYFAEAGISGKSVIGISPSGGWNSKKCNPKKFAEFALAIHRKYNVELLIVWGPGDYNDAEVIKASLPVQSYLAPPTTIKQMAALMGNCDAVIANDSGPMHISAAMGVPTLALFGPTDPRLQGPYGPKNETVRLDSLECINCNLTECPKNQECFNDMPAELVLNTFTDMIKKNDLSLVMRNE